MPETTKIELDPIQTQAVASYQEIKRRIQKDAERFHRYAEKRAQRFSREMQAETGKLFRALAASLGIDLEALPPQSQAWVRPDGKGELVLQGPDPRKPAKAEEPPPAKTEAPEAPAAEAKTDAPADVAEGGKIIQMAGAANGAACDH